MDTNQAMLPNDKEKTVTITAQQSDELISKLSRPDRIPDEKFKQFEAGDTDFDKLYGNPYGESVIDKMLEINFFKTKYRNPFKDLINFCDRQITKAILDNCLLEQKIEKFKHKFKKGDKVRIITSKEQYLSSYFHPFAAETMCLFDYQGIVERFSTSQNVYVDINGKEFLFNENELELIFDYIQAKPEFMNRSDDWDLFPDQDKRVY